MALNLNAIGNTLSLGTPLQVATQPKTLPTTTAPTTVSTVKPMVAPVIPQPTVTQPNISTAVANTEASKVTTTNEQTRIEKAVADEQTRALASQEAASKANQGILSQIMGKQKNPTDLYAQAKIDEGLTQKLEQRQAQETKIASLSKSYQDYKNEIEKQKDALFGQGRGQTIDFLNNQAAQIDKNASYKLDSMAAEINFESAILSIYNENYSEAKSSAQLAVQYAMSGQAQELEMYKLFYDEHLSNFEKVDSIYKDAYTAKMKMLEQDYVEAEKSKTYASENALKYNSMGAGITLNDTPDQVNAKIAAVGGELGYYEKQQALQKKYSVTGGEDVSTPDSIETYAQSYLNGDIEVTNIPEKYRAGAIKRATEMANEALAKTTQPTATTQQTGSNWFGGIKNWFTKPTTTSLPTTNKSYQTQVGDLFKGYSSPTINGSFYSNLFGK